MDPLDGTTNHAHHIPHFCVSIALERAGTLALGVIYDPMHDELYVAERGTGATLNGRPIRERAAGSLAGALVGTGYPYDAWTSAHDNAAETACLVKCVLSLRYTGTTALSLAAVSCSRLDVHWQRRLAPYDTAASVLLIREAGAEILAATPAVHAEMLAYLRTQRR